MFFSLDPVAHFATDGYNQQSLAEFCADINGMKTAATSKKRALKRPSAVTAAAVSSACLPGAALRSGRVDVLLAAPLASIEDAQSDFLALTAALQAGGVAARPWRPWEDSLAESACLHLFGFSEEFLPLADEADRYGLKVVLSPDRPRNHLALGGYTPRFVRGITDPHPSLCIARMTDVSAVVADQLGVSTKLGATNFYGKLTFF